MTQLNEIDCEFFLSFSFLIYDMSKLFYYPRKFKAVLYIFYLKDLHYNLHYD